MIGKRFGRLVVIGTAPRNAEGRLSWLCKCDCGRLPNVTGKSLRGGHTRSCGCLAVDLSRERKPNLRHGYTSKLGGPSPTYQSWISMMTRCNNPNSDRYVDYGARGIRITERWLKFEAFLADMGERPSLKHTLDRVDFAGNYEPENCRWATGEQQGNNKSSNVILEAEGKKQTVSQWAREKGLPVSVLFCRLYKGWPTDRALNEPKRAAKII